MKSCFPHVLLISCLICQAAPCQDSAQTTPIAEKTVKTAPVAEKTVKTAPVTEKAVKTAPVTEKAVKPPPVAEKAAAPAVQTLPPASREDWKGKPYGQQFNVGLMGGMGIQNDRIGFALPLVFSKKLFNEGWIADINNQVFIEGAVGPLFLSSQPTLPRPSTAVTYSAHLRWDFHKDEFWSFYAIGGLGGTADREDFYIHPRFGVGAFYHAFEKISLRLELSHEFIGMGISIPF